MSVVAARSAAAADEAGTAPGDRRFRPDVQGLRAIAILLVVLFHADVPGISGGYVGVDVFFVISGFVITGVLLREREAGRPSLLHFYGRRARRIIPAASLVIVVTVVAAFHFLGPLTGHDTAVDGQWAALFLANVHFAATSTNYLASQRPPSALQNYWSLAVEEQFYVVYPTLFLLTTRILTKVSFRLRLAVVLSTVIVASFVFSIVFTSTNAPSAFFSPLTRAWELALGALIAVGSTSLRRLPQSAAALITWLGLAAIATASVTLTSASVYPGALVAIPVLGAGMVIAGGTAQPAWGAERVLRQRPFQLLGLISYSLYLWHWPILVIATQHRGVASLPVWDNIGLLLVATAVAIVTYLVLENPVRHWKRMVQRRGASIVLGACLIAATLAVTTYEQKRPSVNLGSLAT
jgi:peptidoglycan/LPS O-acetylase OafA/YrhL